MAVPNFGKRRKFQFPARTGLLACWFALFAVMFILYRNSNEYLQTIMLGDISKSTSTRTVSFLSSSKPLDENSKTATEQSDNAPTDAFEKGIGTKHDPIEEFIVGIMFANKKKYLDSLQAQSETWLGAFPKDRVFAVGPTDAINGNPIFPRGVQTPCPDRDLWCKRLKQIPEAYRLLKAGINFDWMLSGNEDWYVNVPAMKSALEGKDPNQPVVYSNLGCSQEWQYHKNSKNNTIPKPQGFLEGIGCKSLRERGGLCLGDGAVISRAAVETMMSYGEAGLFNLTQSQPFEWGTHPQDDPVLSCVVYAFEDKGAKLVEKPWKGQPHVGRGGVVTVDPKTATVHAVPQDGLDAATIIRKAHLSFKKR